MTPSDADRLVELASRCEQATGPDRKLGDEVLIACGWVSIAFGHCWIDPSNTGRKYAPDPTASLDAAMTLVAEDSGMSFAKAVNHSGGWSVALYDEGVMARGATRALALCAAALRARSMMK